MSYLPFAQLDFLGPLLRFLVTAPGPSYSFLVPLVAYLQSSRSPFVRDTRSQMSRQPDAIGATRRPTAQENGKNRELASKAGQKRPYFS